MFILMPLLYLCFTAVPAQDQVPAQSFRFSLVRIPVWVTNQQGIAQHALAARDFQLLVDGSPVTIESCGESFDRPLELVYLHVDDEFAVVNKPPGMITHPVERHTGNSVAEKLAILTENYRQTGRADAGHAVIDISLYPDRFTIPAE